MDATEQVTNPERYVVLHSAADALVSELVHEYDVAESEGPGIDPPLERIEGTRLVRLTPRDGGAPLTIRYTSFPGLWVRFGRMSVLGYPHCGCDYCDEDPTRVVNEFLERVRSLVAGGFSEAAEPIPGYIAAVAEFRFPNGYTRGGAGRAEDAATDIPAPPDGHWRPWPRRV